MAAVREGATLPESRLARFRTVGSALLTGLGFASLLWGRFGPGLGVTAGLLWMGLGALLIFFGVALLSVRFIRPLATSVGPPGAWLLVLMAIIVWPLFTFPYWLLRYGAFGDAPAPKRAGAFVLGALLNPVLLVIVLAMAVRRAVSSWKPEQVEFPGVLPDPTMNRLATENSRRNPQRTASTAAALMIGLALVTLVSLLAAGITSTFRDAVDELWGQAEYAITAENNFSPIPIEAAETVAKLDSVEAVGSVRTGEARVFDETIFATAVTPETSTIFTMEWKEGSQQLLAKLGDDGAFVDDGYADDHTLAVGSPVDVTFATGERKTFVVRGIFEPPAGGSPFGPVTISAATWDRFNDRPRNLYSFVRMRGGQTDANFAQLQRTLADFPNAKAQTREDFVDNQISGLSAILNILYVLLALSVVVSLFGIINTLVLTVFERTREIGMLRAIGMTRRQVRRMIRQESVITALIGGALGIVLGIVLAALLIARVEFIDFSLPVGSLIVFTLAAILVGIVAAIAPARRAARLDVLKALQYE
jgi:ABC-type lipoprotein release transport system permease subunit